MSNQCDCLGVDDILEPQNLRFNLEPSEGNEVTYRATIGDLRAPGAPEFALTVITARPSSPREETDLERFLGQIKAAFVLLAPETGEWSPAPPGERPVRTGSDVLIIPELVNVGIDSVFTVVFVVEAEIAGGKANPVAGWGKRVLLRVRIPWNLPGLHLNAGLTHQYWSTSGHKISGSVVWRGGYFSADGHWLPTKAGRKKVKIQHRRVITVHASLDSKYDILGSFQGTKPNTG